MVGQVEWEKMVHKTFNPSQAIEQPPVVEFPPLTESKQSPSRSYDSDDDLDYSYNRGSPSVGGGAIITCVILILFGFLKVFGYI